MHTCVANVKKKQKKTPINLVAKMTQQSVIVRKSLYFVESMATL